MQIIKAIIVKNIGILTKINDINLVNSKINNNFVSVKQKENKHQ